MAAVRGIFAVPTGSTVLDWHSVRLIRLSDNSDCKTARTARSQPDVRCGELPESTNTTSPATQHGCDNLYNTASLVAALSRRFKPAIADVRLSE